MMCAQMLREHIMPRLDALRKERHDYLAYQVVQSEIVQYEKILTAHTYHQNMVAYRMGALDPILHVRHMRPGAT